jgi:hypothetical protein
VNDRVKFIAWVAVIAVVTFAVVYRVAALKRLVMGA